MQINSYIYKQWIWEKEYDLCQSNRKVGRVAKNGFVFDIPDSGWQRWAKPSLTLIIKKLIEPRKTIISVGERAEKSGREAE